MSEHTYLTNNHNYLKKISYRITEGKSEAFPRDGTYEFDFKDKS